MSPPTTAANLLLSPAMRGQVRKEIGLALLLLLVSGCAQHDRLAALLDPSSGGATTVHDATRNAYSQPAANLDVQRRGEFFIGNAFFNSPWIVAPASAGARDGLGPLFNARSCDACHNNDGRGRPPEHAGEQPVSLVLQFATPTPGVNNEPQSDPRYGANFNPFAIGGVPAEGAVRITYREIRGEFADGEPYVLLAPEYALREACVWRARARHRVLAAGGVVGVRRRFAGSHSGVAAPRTRGSGRYEWRRRVGTRESGVERSDPAAGRRTHRVEGEST